MVNSFRCDAFYSSVLSYGSGVFTMENEPMNLVFEMEHVICSPNADYNLCRPIANVTEFMQWLVKQGHHITIWTKRSNELETKMKTEDWLKIHQIPYNRLLFDRPRNAVFVNETPSNTIYLGSDDMNVFTTAELFKEWKRSVGE